MMYLFEERGLKMLEAFCYADALMAFDFDGTLAPIVTNPKDASLSKTTDGLLQKLRERTALIVISGRGRNDLLARLPQSIDFAIGNHGLEGLPSTAGNLQSAADLTQFWASKLESQVEKLSGVVIENKTYSLAIHYRQAKDKRKTKAKLVELVTDLHPGPRILLGKYVINLVASGAPHKGVALLELMIKTGKRSAIYIGDDDNDEDVFRLGEESLLTIRVGQDEDSAAMFYLKDQSEIDRVIGHCLEVFKKIGQKRND